MRRKPNICVEFDGPIHSYVSGWKGVFEFPDPPSKGALRWLIEMSHHFTVNVVSPRSRDPGAIQKMQTWLVEQYAETGLLDKRTARSKVTKSFEWPVNIPPYLMYISDRSFRFQGEFPTVDVILSYRPQRGEAAKEATLFPREIAHQIVRELYDQHDETSGCEFSVDFVDNTEPTCVVCRIDNILRPLLKKARQ